MSTFASLPITSVFTSIFNFMHNILMKLDFTFYGSVTFLRLIIGFLILSACITVFWKGAKG